MLGLILTVCVVSEAVKRTALRNIEHTLTEQKVASFISPVRCAGVGGEVCEGAEMGDVRRKQSRRWWVSVTWRLCNLSMSAFFSLAAYVQINDPDAGLWMAGYGVPAGLSGLVALEPQVTETLPWRRTADLHVMLSVAVVAMLGWRLDKERLWELLQQEEGREFSGLVLTTAWLVLCRHSGRAPVGTLRVSTAVAIAVFPFVAWLYFHGNEELRSSWPTHCKNAI